MTPSSPSGERPAASDETTGDDERVIGGYWGRVSHLVVDHPVRVLLLAGLLLIPPLFALPSMRLSNDTLDELPEGSPSVVGFDALTDHFPAGEVSPVLLVIDDDEPVTQEASFRALADLSKNLKRLPGVATVRSVAMPTNGEQPDLAEVQGAGQAAALPDQLKQAASGAARIEDGLERARQGVAEIDSRLPELRDGLGEAEDGAGRLLDGVIQVRDGIDQVRAGLGELGTGLQEAQDGTDQLRSEVALPAEDAIRAAWETLFDEFTIGRGDPAYQDALEEVGETYGRITGEDPTTGEQVDPRYEGLPEALAELSTGLGEAIAGVGRLDAGLGEIDGGLAEIEDGLARLRDGLGEAEGGVAELQDGIDRLLDGLTQLEDGAGRLADGLNDGVRRLEDAGLQDLLPGGGAGPFVLTAGMLDAVPDLREELGFFLAEDETRTRMFIGLEGNPFAPESIETVDTIHQVTELSLTGSPLSDATWASTGVSAFFNEVDEVSDRDFRIILVAVLAGVFLVLVLLLRAIVAPLYMVATVLLSFGTALGITTIVYQGLFGSALAWWIPPFLYVLLVALGADYNIYLMSRVREEANTRTTRRAVTEGTRATGHVITSAGLILAGTFAALMAAPMTSLAQMGFATTVGILLDTFVVRSFVVPSLAALFGRHNWWPSSRAYAD